MKSTHIVVVALVTSAIAASALAHGGATGIVKNRMEAMSNLGQAVKAIAEIVRRKLPYDATVVRNNAMVIRRHSGLAMTKLFPQNSLQKASEARKTIWSNWDEFNELARRLETLSMGLEIAADNGLSTANSSKTNNVLIIPDNNLELSLFENRYVDEVFGMLAITCSTCHEKFRLKKN